MFKKIHKESPMVIYFLCLASGIIFSLYLDFTFLTISIITISFIFILILFYKFDINKYGYFLLLILLGIVASSRYNLKNKNHLSNFNFPSEKYHISGKIISRRIYPNKQRIALKNITIEDVTFSGKVLTTIKNPCQQFFNGDTIEYIGSLYFPDGARNPGEFDYCNYLNKRNIYMLSYADEKTDYSIHQNKSLSLIKFADKFKSKIIANINNSMTGEPANILKALIVGARDELEGETTEIFVYSGTIHILAVSGLHVAYVTLSLLVIFSFFRFRDKQRTILTIIGLVFYIFIVDFKPSVIRAVIMASLILIGKSWEKRVNVYNSLATAGFIQLLISPMQLFDAGFQLSFSAVYSIIYFHSRIKILLSEKFQPFKIKFKSLRYFYQLFLVSLAALIGTLPITAYYFNRISPVGLLANLFAIPIIGAVGATGFAQVILGFFIPTVNLFYGQVNQLLLWLLIKLTNFSASIPYGSINVPEINLLIVIIFYFLIFAIFNLEKRKVKVAFLIGILLLLNFQIWSSIFQKPKLEVIFFDVGQGDAALVKFPTGEKMLIDAGDRTFSRNYAESVLLPFFIRQNIRHLDVVALSHPHSDHIGGVPFLLENISIREIWEPNVDGKSKTFKQIHIIADSLQVPIKNIHSGDYFNYSECDLYVLHPSREYIKTEPGNYNHYSTAIKLSYKDFDILFTGDIEKEDEAYISLFDDFIDCEILKVPHHGSSTSSSEKFIQKVSPEIAFVSVGRKNKFKHPSDKIMLRYCDNGVIIHRSDKNHSLRITSDGSKYYIR